MTRNVPGVRGYSTAPFPPVCLVENAPDDLALKTDWHSRPPVLILCVVLVVLGTPVEFWAIYYGLPLIDRLTGGGQLLGGDALLVVSALAAVFWIAFVGWASFKQLRNRGPIHFDRDSGCIRFGPAARQQTRPLNEITAVEFYPVSIATLQNAILAEPVPTNKPPPAWLSNTLKWCGRQDAKLIKRRRYQLDLVFSDGTRLYLTNGTNPEPIQAVASQLADFVRVPLIDKAAD
jgi:hypothetical protein